MRTISLQSGSNGNCIYVESEGTRLLFDAGISGKQTEERLAGAGIDIRSINAVIISHDHADHIGSVRVLGQRYRLPIFMTRGTLGAAREKLNITGLEGVEEFAAGEVLEFGGVAVHTIATPHDCAEGVGFVVEAQKKRLGILTDLGHVFAGLAEVVATLDAVFMESNYDVKMLETGGYPEVLKARIRGNGGHLSNVEAAELIRSARSARLRWVCLAHLSENNNEPVLAVRTHREIVGTKLPLGLASRYARTKTMEV